jgi:DNA topoisomerase-3
MAIVKRFAAHFLPKAVYEQTEIMTRVDAYDFISRGNVLVEPGWKVLYGKDTEEPDEEQPKMVKVTQNEAVSLVKSNLLAKQTKPAKPHTEASLLSAMVNCGNEKSEDILPGFCVGTEATRAEVLKKIQEIGYVKSSGKSLRITPMGISLVELFPIKQMLEPRYTGQIEKALFEIQNGRFDPDVFMDKIVALVKSGVDQMKGTKGSIGKEVTVLGKCPECGRDVVENAKAFGCSGYKEGCKFAIWKDNALFKSMKKKLTPTMVKGFLSGKVVTVKGCTSKSGKEYDARLKLGRQDNGFWGFTFEK